jgi:hypothetical protein
VNIDIEDLWTCYSSDFPVVKVANDTTQLWRNTNTGYRSINSVLVDRNRVALIDRETAVLGRLEDGEFRRTKSVAFDLPPHAGGQGAKLIGQGPVLHVITSDGSWFKTDLDSLEATAS